MSLRTPLEQSCLPSLPVYSAWSRTWHPVVADHVHRTRISTRTTGRTRTSRKTEPQDSVNFVSFHSPGLESRASSFQMRPSPASAWGGLRLSCNLMTRQSLSARHIWGLARCLAPPLHPCLFIYCLLSSPCPSLWCVYLQQPERPPYTHSLLGSVYLSTPINRLHSIWRAFALKTFPCQSLPPH